MTSRSLLSRSVLFGAINVLCISTSAAANIPQTIEQLSLGGATSIISAPVGSGVFSVSETTVERTGAAAVLRTRSVARRANLPIPGKSGDFGGAEARPTTLPLAEPVVEGTRVAASQAEGFLGFNGLTHIDQRVAGGNTQFSGEPPDQGLCAGNGFVVEAVNNAIRVYNTSGVAVTGIDTLNHFFKLAVQVDRTKLPSVAGPFLSDPKCLYDRQTSRWFLTQLMQDNGGNAGATGRNFQLIAVSNTSSPAGQWTIFRFDNTNDGANGTPNHAGCPCFGDQPLIGIDQYAFYISTNEFGDHFNGAQVYAVSKRGLAQAAGAPHPVLPLLVHLNAGPALLPFGGLSYTIQPRLNLPSVQDADAEDSGALLNKHGVEYFLSALQFGNPGYEVYDNRIALWALTNSASLETRAPAVTLSVAVLASQTYGQPDPADQKPGPIPLATCLNIDCLGIGVLPSAPNVLEQISTNDDRMNQVVYARGLLFAAVNSKLKVNGEDLTGIAWFGVKPSWQGNNLNGRVERRGYIAVAKNNVIFPSVGLNDSGDGAMVFTLVGRQYHPSAAYATFSADQGPSDAIHIARAGAGPADGFSGYDPFNDTEVPVRWGDYSAASSDGDRVFFATEYIPSACPTLFTSSCRTVLANWGGFIGSVKEK